MNNSELNHLLKTAPVPEPPPRYWDTFPRRVLAQINSPGQPAFGVGTFGPRISAFRFASALLRLPALRIGLAAVCLVLGLALILRPGPRSPATATGEHQLAEAQKCFHEIESLFPNQVQAIVLDPQGALLLLADDANVPVSPPLYLKICGPNGCQRFVTFSGQQIRINGDLCEVLVDRRGNVLLVGRNLLWSSSEPAGKTGPYRIEAQPLGAA